MFAIHGKIRLMDSRERVRLLDDISRATDIVSLAYACASLTRVDGSCVPEAELCFAYLKLYFQTPHARTRQLKPEDKSRFIEMSAMPPREWLDFVEEPMLTCQENGARALWVYDGDNGCRLEDYLLHFYRELYPQGWAVGLSPMGLFQTVGESNFYARCLQLDLEESELNWPNVTFELQARVKHPSDPVGFLTSSSPQGMHFHGSTYYPYEATGKVNLGVFYGCALLMNREGQHEKVDARSIGHQLRSLTEEWRPNVEDSEVGCLRITRSLLKPYQPEFITMTPEKD